ncbi:MAG: hypothetical protein HQM00_16865, partial [Magnetococcales bacterium]|nr:hypothetical protein [Magnetococcales bacterium]
MHTFEEVIRYAIRHEEEEAAFYLDLAERSPSGEQRAIMLAHARQEEEHKRRLEAILLAERLPATPPLVLEPVW